MHNKNSSSIIMEFNSLCKNAIFKEGVNYEDIKVDKHIDKIFSSVFTRMSVRYVRLGII